MAVNSKQEKKLRDHWGPKCKEYEPLCACCAAWKLYSELGRVPTESEVNDKLSENRNPVDFTKPIEVVDAGKWQPVEFIAEDEHAICFRLNGNLRYWSKGGGDIRNTPPTPDSAQRKAAAELAKQARDSAKASRELAGESHWSALLDKIAADAAARAGKDGGIEKMRQLAWCIKGDGELYLCGISENSEDSAWEAFGRECLGWRYESIEATKKLYTEKHGYKAVRVVVTEEQP